MALPEPGVFPLTSGIHALEVSGRGGASLDSEQNRIVFQTKRVGEPQTQTLGGLPIGGMRHRSRSGL